MKNWLKEIAKNESPLKRVGGLTLNWGIKMTIKSNHTYKEQVHVEESTRYWFSITGLTEAKCYHDDGDYAIVDTNGNRSIIDAEGYPVEWHQEELLPHMVITTEMEQDY